MTNIFVGNLSYSVTESDLEGAFSAFGPVERVSVVRDRESGQSRGFGFVEMANAGNAAKAIAALNGTEMKGRNLNVNEARPREQGGGGGGFNRNRGGGGGGSRREPRW